MSRKRDKITQTYPASIEKGDVIRMVKDCLLGDYEEGDIGEVVQPNFLYEVSKFHVVLVRELHSVVHESDFVVLKTK